MLGPQTLKVVDTTIKQKVMWNTAVDDKLEKQDWKRTTKYKKYIFLKIQYILNFKKYE